MKNENRTIERKSSYEKTEKESQKLIHKLESKGIEFRKGYLTKNDPYPTTYMTLLKDGRHVVGGNGKGEGIQSEFSATFEAFEHLVNEPFYINQLAENWTKKVKYMHHSEILSQNDMLNEMIMFKNFSSCAIDTYFPCVELKSLLNSDEKIFLPWAFLTPSYPFPYIVSYKNVEHIYDIPYMTMNDDSVDKYLTPHLENCIKYTCTNGGGAGIDLEDTILHAVNELIERDAISLFLLESFSNKRIEQFKLVNKLSLPSRLKEICSYIEKTYDKKLLILNITSDIGVPSFTVYGLPDKGSRYGAVRGYGSSIDKSYAIERALLEYKQMLDNMIAMNERGPNVNHIRIAKKLKSKFHYKAFTHLPKIFKKCSMEDFDENHCNSQSLNVEDMLSTVIDRIASHGYVPFVYSEKILETNVTYVKVLIPGFEHLNGPTNILLPSRRGLNRLDKYKKFLRQKK